MNIFTYFKKAFFLIIRDKYTGILDYKDIKIEYPKNMEYGDLSTNVAMIIAKKLSCSTNEIASVLSSDLKNNEFIEKIQIANAGFLNMKLTKTFWHMFLKDLIKFGIDYPKASEHKKVNIEFVSANPTGPLHIGHAKGAVFGDSIANLLLKCGYNITKEFYINDGGKQITNLARSLNIRYRQILGEKLKLDNDCYPGEYLIEIAQELYNIHNDNLTRFDESEQEEIFKNFAVEKILEVIKQDLEELGVYYDVFTSEKNLNKEFMVEYAIDFLEKKELLYEGVLEKPKGEVSEDWEANKQLLFKSKQFGDSSDRTIIKSDGTYTYFASDIAYHFDKIKRGYNDIILLLGADHIGYEKRLISAVKALSDGKVKLNIKFCQLVKLLKGGEQVKMSKRSGNFVTLKEMLDEIGRDALRFAILTKSSDTILNIDMEKIKQQTKDNPLFYIQYAAARANSIFKRAKKIGIDIKNITIDTVNLSLLDTQYDIGIIKYLALYTKVLESCINTLDIHKITYYLYELACKFHQIWSYKTKGADIKFVLESNVELTKARIFLAKAVLIILTSGLEILGIKAVESM